MNRSLHDIIDKLLIYLSKTESEKATSLHTRLKVLQDLLYYTAPEVMGDRWSQFLYIINNEHEKWNECDWWQGFHSILVFDDETFPPEALEKHQQLQNSNLNRTDYEKEFQKLRQSYTYLNEL